LATRNTIAHGSSHAGPQQATLRIVLFKEGDFGWKSFAQALHERLLEIGEFGACLAPDR